MTWDTIVGTPVGSGWLITDHQARKPGDTGGNFSEGFAVTKNGQPARGEFGLLGPNEKSAAQKLRNLVKNAQ